MIADTQGQDIAIATRPKRHWRRWVIILLVVVASSVMAWPLVANWHQGVKQVDAKELSFATVERGDLIRNVAVSGRLVAAHAPQLYSSEPGIVTLLARPGDRVEQNQLIAQIDSPELEAELRQGQSELDKLRIDASRGDLADKETELDLQSSLDSAQLELTSAQREYERAEISHQKQVISEQDWRKSQDTLDEAHVLFRHAQQKVQLAKERLRFEQQNRDYAIRRQQLVVDELQRRHDALQITAPVTGMVGNWSIEQKERVAKATPLLTVIDLSRYEAELNVPEFYADDLGLGMGVSMTVAGTNYKGEILAISPEIQANQVKVRVSIDDASQSTLRQNQRINARIEFEKKTNVLKVKRGEFLSSSAGQLAYRLNPNDTASQQAITVGSSSVDYVEIISGLNEGDTIIRSSYEDFIQSPTIKLNR